MSNAAVPSFSSLRNKTVLRAREIAEANLIRFLKLVAAKYLPFWLTSDLMEKIRPISPLSLSKCSSFPKATHKASNGKARKRRKLHTRHKSRM